MQKSDISHAKLMQKLLAELPQNLDDSTSLKNYLNRVLTAFNTAFVQGENIENLVLGRAKIMDNLIASLYKHYNFTSDNLVIFAVGGYGRGQLHPYSDLDLLFYVNRNISETLQSKLQEFINQLWSLDLKIAQNIISKADITKLGTNITTYTAWLEARQIAGQKDFITEFKAQLQQIWSFADFTRAKIAEQNARYAKYSEPDYLLEPNIKKSAGGLRDIHTINWLILKLTNANFLDLADFIHRVENSEHAEFKYLNENQAKLKVFAGDFCQQLGRLRAGLWQIRYALHYLENKGEDRILFNYQTQLAKILGFDKVPNKYGDYNFSQTQLMRYYFGLVRQVEFLNRIFLQSFAFDEITPSVNTKADFVNSEKGLGVLDNLDKKDASWILLALVLLSTGELENLMPENWLAIRKNLHLINKEFLHREGNRRAFLQIFAGKHVYKTLDAMLLTGVLEKYLKDFARLKGVMQYDLAHIHAIDKHLLHAVKFLEFFNLEESGKIYPLANEIMQSIENKDRLYLAGLFHDIGKGLGGQHAQKGVQIFLKFAKLHTKTPIANLTDEFLTPAEIDEIVFLIEQHLLMSETAQKQDLSEIKFIRAFVDKVKTLDRLNKLYLLTLADISATSPKLWNNWRASLLRQLYFLAKDFIVNGEQIPSAEQQAQQIKQASLEMLVNVGFEQEEVANLWQELGEDYFSSFQAEEVFWQSRGILNNYVQNKGKYAPLVLIDSPEVEFATAELRGTKIFIYAKDEKYIFAKTVNALQKLNLNILEARINTADNAMVLNSFVVLEKCSESSFEKWRIEQIQNQLVQSLENPYCLKDKPSRRYLSRRQKYYQNWTQVNLSYDDIINQHVLEVKTRDKAGILVEIAQIFIDYAIDLQHAKITTLANRVEDVFYWTTTKNWTPTKANKLLKTIKTALDRE